MITWLGTGIEMNRPISFEWHIPLYIPIPHFIILTTQTCLLLWQVAFSPTKCCLLLPWSSLENCTISDRNHKLFKIWDFKAESNAWKTVSFTHLHNALRDTSNQRIVAETVAINNRYYCKSNRPQRVHGKPWQDSYTSVLVEEPWNSYGQVRKR